MKLVLVDGSNAMFRAFYAIRNMNRADGMATNAVYGVATMLEGLLRDEAPDAIAVAFDRAEPTFRAALYPPYKAHRPPMPEDLRPQVPWILDVVRAMGIQVLELAGWEADDILATLASQAAADGARVTIVSTDKDLAQLVDGRVELLDTMKGVRYGPAEVEARWGVPPHRFVEFQALCGDSSDNIPGVRGIGDKGAAKLIAAHGSLEGVYAALGDLRGKLRENLEADRGNAELSRQLATLRRDVPLHLGWRALRRAPADAERLGALFAALEFRTLAKRLLGAATGAAVPQALSRRGDQLVTSAAALDAMVQALRAAGSFAFDTETTGLDPHTDTLVGLSFAIGTDQSYYVPIGHQRGAAPGAQTGLFDEAPTLDPRQLPAAVVLAAIRPLFADARVGKRAQHAKFDIAMLAGADVPVQGLAFDPMLADYLLDPAAAGGHGLDAMARRWLGHEAIAYDSLLGTAGNAGFARVSIDDAVPYACEDAQLVEALAAAMRPRLAAEGLAALLDELELPLELVLCRMELAGIGIDADGLRALSVELRARAATIEVEAHAAAGRPFALGSPKQLAGVLFGDLALPVRKRTATGPSTDSSVLEQLADEHPLPGLVLAWRSLTKLDGTYASVLPGLVHPRTGRVHTRYQQAVAATGRLSSVDPNLQNIPIRGDDGRRIRACFVAAPGHRLIAADYSQIELRVLAHVCGDPALQQAFRDGADVHARTAAQLFGVAEAAVTRDQRAAAKTVNFGILYGMSATRLAREQGLSRAEATALIARYFERYPAIEAWKERTLAEARSSGQTRTLAGRLRRLPELASDNRGVVATGERIAINTPIQGTAADIIKRAMVALDARLQRELPSARLLLQVHDELVIEAPEVVAAQAAAICREEMAQAMALDVPLEVDTGIGDNWLQAHGS